MIDKKVCTFCNIEKTLEEYYRCSKCKDGRASYCKECCKKLEKDKKEGIIHSRTGIYDIKRGDPLYHRIRTLKTSYGISYDEYIEILDSQDNVCAICKNPETNDTWKTGKTNHLSIDHDHTTYKIRGILCSKCNSAIGLLMDSPKLLLEAAKYLIKSRLEDKESEEEVLKEINELLEK